MLRDISERGRDLEQILSQYITFVKPAFEEFCLPVSCALGLLPSLEIKSIRRTRLRVAAVLCAEGPGRGMSRPLPSSSVLPLVFPLARRFPSWNPSGLCTPCWAGSGCGGPFIGGQTRPSGSEPRCRVPLQRPPALRRPPSVRLPPRAFPSVCGGGVRGALCPEKLPSALAAGDSREVAFAEGRLGVGELSAFSEAVLTRPRKYPRLPGEKQKIKNVDGDCRGPEDGEAVISGDSWPVSGVVRRLARMCSDSPGTN